MSVEIIHMDNLILSGTLQTLLTLGVGGYLFKRWMDKTEETAKTDKAENKQDLKDIKGSIDKLVDHVAVANGRTAKLEGAVRSIKDVCAERHGK